MFDKITIRAKVSSEECAHLATLHCLQSWVNSENNKVNYRSSQHANTTGIQVQIYNNKMTLKCSLHKYWEKRNFGKLRNDTMFTISEAKSAFEMLLFENGLIASKVNIIEFELGLNMYVSYDPITFIEKAGYIFTAKKITKEMFNDANYKKDRQRTTEKSPNYRKYYKIYDKGWEMEKKSRKKKEEQDQETKEYKLRIETVHRRYNERADLFFSDQNIKQLVQLFYVEWKDLFFFRDVRAYKGARSSEIDRARFIINYGTEEYLKQIKSQLSLKKITDKQYRTIREFIRDFSENEHKYKTIISPQEKEYNMLFTRVFMLCKC